MCTLWVIIFLQGHALTHFVVFLLLITKNYCCFFSQNVVLFMLQKNSRKNCLGLCKVVEFRGVTCVDLVFYYCSKSDATNIVAVSKICDMLDASF